MKLSQRKALVTGAGSGLGRAIALTFAREGADVAVNDLHKDAAEAVATEIQALGRQTLVFPVDVSDSLEVRVMFENLAAQWGYLDILVNNAGIVAFNPEVQRRLVERHLERATARKETTPLGATRAVTDMEWRRTLAVHLDGTFYCTREALKLMEPRGYGKIINMASVAGLTGLLGAPAYSAAKAGIIGLTKAVAREAILSGVYVNAIAPGFVDTPLLADLDPRVRQAIATQTPIGRFGNVEEIAALALHLASDDSSFTVGQVVSPNGGLYM